MSGSRLDKENYFENLLLESNDYTEFIQRNYDDNEQGLSLEIIKKLINIYLSSFISFADIIINKDDNECLPDNNISAEYTEQVLSGMMNICKGILSSCYIELIYLNFCQLKKITIN